MTKKIFLFYGVLFSVITLCVMTLENTENLMADSIFGMIVASVLVSLVGIVHFLCSRTTRSRRSRYTDHDEIINDDDDFDSDDD